MYRVSLYTSLHFFLVLVSKFAHILFIYHFFYFLGHLKHIASHGMIGIHNDVKRLYKEGYCIISGNCPLIFKKAVSKTAKNISKSCGFSNKKTLTITQQMQVVVVTSRLICSLCFFVCIYRDSPLVGQGLLFQEVSRSHTTKHHSR